MQVQGLLKNCKDLEQGDAFFSAAVVRPLSTPCDKCLKDIPVCGSFSLWSASVHLFVLPLPTQPLSLLP